MLYFSGVFQQHYLSASPLQLATSGTPNDLTAGQLAFYQTDTNGLFQGAVTSGTTKNVTLTMGSWHTIDAPGANYTGLKVPQYSKTINWNRVSLFQYIKGHALQQQIVSIGWDQTLTGSTSTVGPVFYCATSYDLKVEVLGDAALAAMNKNVYNNLSAWGGCCSTGCSSGCTSTAVDAAYIMLQWKDRVNQNPVLNQFILPQVFVSSGATKVEVFDAYDNSLDSSKTIYTPNTANPTSVIASFQLIVAYVATTFGICTFTPRDRFEYTPLWIQASLVSQSPDPCAWNTTINTSVPNMFTVLQAPKAALATGDFILREYITSDRYRQQPFADGMYADDLRFREIENVVSTNNIVRSAIYDQIVLVHSVPRRDNPTAVHSNDQYMVIIDVPAATVMTDFINIISNSLALVGSNVTLETIS